ncbi:MAG: hypothetical protein ACQEWM_10445 [Actinomycetota bacterium]
MLTRGAAIGGGLLLLGVCVLGILDEEVLRTGDGIAQLFFRATMGCLLPLALVAAIGEPLRLALERTLLLRSAERAEHDASPPLVERTALDAGPHEALWGLGLFLAIAAGIALPITLIFAADDGESPLARALAPLIAALLLVVGVVLARIARARGGARAAWGARLGAVARRWRGGPQPQPRSHRRVRFGVLGAASFALGVGGMVLMAGVSLRQPGRDADPRSFDEPGELAIDGLVLTGSVVMVIATIVLLLAGATLLALTAVQDARAVRALEHGDRARLEQLDAVLLDASPLERAAMALGVAAWLALSVAWAHGWAVVLEDAAQAAPLQPLTVVGTPAAIALALAWLLASVGVARSSTRRARVHAALLRDPIPTEDPDAPADRRADAVRDVALAAERSERSGIA